MELKFKYQDKVKIIKDKENKGFFVGTTGKVQLYVDIQKHAIPPVFDGTYEIDIGHPSGKFFYAKEEDLELVKD